MKSFARAYLPENLPWTFKFGNIAVFIYASTSMFYIFPSGLPQIPDYILALAIVFAFLGFMMRVNARFDAEQQRLMPLWQLATAPKTN